MPTPLIEASYRNKLEASVGNQLSEANIPFGYETLKLPVAFPPRTGRYTPDFVFDQVKVLIETKGFFYDSAADRQKLCLVKEQHPDWDIWLLFQRPGCKIYKGSKTTYEQWAGEHGFRWATGKTIPSEWIADLRKRHSSLRRKKEASRCRSTNSPRQCR